MSAISLTCESAETASAVSMSLHEASTALARANLSASTRGVSEESFARAFISNSATFFTNFDIFLIMSDSESPSVCWLEIWKNDP